MPAFSSLLVWVTPALGTLRLEKLALEPELIDRWINRLGRRQCTVTARCVLRSALAWEMTKKQLTYNPATLVRVRRTKRQPITTLSTAQAQQLLAVTSQHPLGAAITISLTMGLRIGEVTRLAWRHLDTETRMLQVRQQVQPLLGKGQLVVAPLKTAQSRRTPTMLALVVEAIKARRVANSRNSSGPRAGAAWQHRDDLVFTDKRGGPVHPSAVRDVLDAFLRTAGAPRVKYHALRHTAATLLLVNGTPLFDVSRVLGHSTIGITADFHGHLTPDITANAAAKMDALLAGT